MQYQFPLFALAHVLAAVLSLVLAVMVLTRRANSGYLQFTGILLILFFWSCTTFMEVGALDVDGKRFWSQWQYLAVVSLGPVWLLFTAHLSRKKAFLSNPWHHLIWLVPLITLFAAFTDQYYGLLWGSITIPDNLLYHIAVYGRGPVFLIHITFSYTLLLIGTLWLVKSFLDYPQKRKKQLVVILAMLAIGWAANIIYILGLSPIAGLDLTSLAFTFIALALFWFISSNRLFDLVPIARSKVIDNLTHGVIVINDEGIIIDFNPAALDITGYRGPSPIGMTVWDMFADYADLIQPFRDQSNLQAEIEMPTTPPRYLDVQVTAFQGEDNDGLRAGQIITIRDITARKHMQIIEADQRSLAEALADSAAVINSSLHQDEVLERILENVGKVVPHDAANISLVDERGDVRFVRTRGYERFGSNEQVLNVKFNIAKVPNLRKMAQTGQPSINKDTQNDPDWVKGFEDDYWIRSYIGAPIISKGRLLGFISLDAETPNFFKIDQLNRLRAFADQAAIAIENAQLFSVTSRRAEEMRILYEIGLAVTSGLGLDNTIRTLYDQLSKVIPIDFFYLALVNQAENSVSFRVYDEAGNEIQIPDIPLLDQPSLTRYTIEKQRTVYIPDVHAPDAEFPYEKTVKVTEHEENTHLGIPLILSGRVLGVLAMCAKVINAYSPDQIRLVETIANQASIAMENAQMFEKMQHLAVTDSLTGLYNRHYFFPFAENEIERSRRYHKELSIILMDIDHFKRVNDSFGHQSGDQTLKMVAEICLEELRKVDVMCRFGGEEFLILLPETPEVEAGKAAKRICEAIAAARLPVEGGEIAVTVSMGVASLDDEHEDINALIQTADKALYQAKEAGRNRVEVI